MRRILQTILIALGLSLPGLMVPAMAWAGTPNPNACPDSSSSSGQVLSGIGETGNGCNSSGVPSLLATATNILSIIVGAIAVIMIILAGFKYITSGGESGKVTNAKNTLLYALIGVAIAALAQLLVHYVLNQANSIG